VSIIARLFPTIKTAKAKIAEPKTIILYDGREILVHFKKMAQSKRLRLRVNKDGKSVIVTMPKSQNIGAALKFAQNAKSWIQEQLSKHEIAQPFVIGGDIPIFGKKTILQIAAPRSKMILLQGEAVQTLIIGSLPENFSEKTKSALKKLAHEAALTHVKIFEPKLEKQITKLRITDTKSRWGSCSHDGVVSLCWRLVFAPIDVFHYVLAHELAHLTQMNHSPKFWQEVERLMPNYKIHRDWLRKNGMMLHRIGN
jgi:predicted metal-dependent hydrolase